MYASRRDSTLGILPIAAGVAGVSAIGKLIGGIFGGGGPGNIEKSEYATAHIWHDEYGMVGDPRGYQWLIRAAPAWTPHPPSVQLAKALADDLLSYHPEWKSLPPLLPPGGAGAFNGLYVDAGFRQAVQGHPELQPQPETQISSSGYTLAGKAPGSTLLGGMSITTMLMIAGGLAAVVLLTGRKK